MTTAPVFVRIKCVVVGELLMLTVAILGIAALVAVLGPVFTVLQVVGAAYLVYLGLKRWKRAGAQVAENASDSRENGLMQVALGLGMTLSNPIAIAFYLALLPGVVDISSITIDVYLALVAIIVAVMILTVTAYGLVGEFARKVFTGGRTKMWMERVAGAMFIAAGVWVAARPLL